MSSQDFRKPVRFIGNNSLKLGLFLFIVTVVYSGFFLVSADIFVSFNRNLKLGDRGEDVFSLQKFLNSDLDTRISNAGLGSPGFETNYFGSLTKNAVIRFQEKYKNEVLTPVGLSRGTGFVGFMTIKKLNDLVKVGATVSTIQVNPHSLPAIPPDVYVSPALAPNMVAPTITSVYPSWARRGDTITIVGTNFAPTSNTVTLIDGPIDTRFSNLNSPDGKTITFVFEPPTIKTMSEMEIRALPSNLVDQIEKPIKAVNKTLADALLPYKNINSESELRASLQKNSHSFDEIYNFYFVTVENSRGKAISETALLHGLRSLPIPGLATGEGGAGNILSSFSQYLGKAVMSLFTVAYAQGQYGGGINSGIIMICTCGDGYLTFMTDYNGGGTGLYWFSWGFMANVGGGYRTPYWLGGYQTMTATCSIYAGEDCVNINANEPKKPWGTNL